MSYFARCIVGFIIFLVLAAATVAVIDYYHPEWIPKVQTTYVETYVDPDTGVNYLIYHNNGEITMCPKYDDTGNLIISEV